MKKYKRSIAIVSTLVFLLTLFMPSIVLATQFSTKPVTPQANLGYDASKQADAMIKSHGSKPKIDEKLAKKLKSTKKDEFIPIIIHLKDKADLKKINAGLKNKKLTASTAEQHKKTVTGKLKEHAQKTQKSLLTTLDNKKKEGKATKVKSYWLFNGVTAKVTKDVIYELASDPKVEKVVFNDIKFTAVSGKVESKSVQKVKPTNTVPKQTSALNTDPITWGIEKIGADQVWSTYGLNGTGVVVGHLDTGIDPTHPDLLINPNGDPYDIQNWKLVGWAEFDYDGYLASDNPYDARDYDGHGTHTAGTILGNKASGTAIGVAPGARIVSGKVLDDYGVGSFEQVVAGMEWIVTVPGVRVVNMSLGGDGAYAEMIEPTRNMVDMLVFPAFSIGNSGAGSSGSPGNVPAAFGVGATDVNDIVAGFSSGEMVNWTSDPYNGQYLKPDVSAPGVEILSSIPGGGYEAWDGTSMAAPHVAGAVALILQQNPWLSVDEIKSLLKLTAVDLGITGPDTRYGSGRINVKAAIDMLKTSGFINGYVMTSDDEPIEADIALDGKVIAKADPVNGSYALVSPKGSHTVKASHFYYRDESITTNVIINQITDRNFIMTKKMLGTFTGIVKNAAGQPIQNAVISIDGIPGGAVKTDSQGKYRLTDIPEGKYQLKIAPPIPYAYQQTEGTIPTGGGLVTKDFNLKNGNILLIDHDFGNDWHKYYIGALEKNGYSVAYWDWDSATMKGTEYLPSFDALKNFDKVVLADFDGNTIYIDDEALQTNILRQYLDSGRKMLIAGQDIGFMSSMGNYYTNFYKNYLHAKYINDDPGSRLLKGTTGEWPKGIFEGLDINIDFGADAANNQWFPDTIAPADKYAVSIANFIDTYSDNTVMGSGALAIDSPAHRLVYFSFGFEGINDEAMRTNVMNRVMKYLDSPVENTSPSINYSNAWNMMTDSNATAGRYRLSNFTNATTSFKFTGDNITWITAKGPAYGKAQIQIDGVTVKTVDLYSSTQTWQHRESITGLDYGEHTITIKVLGQKATASSGTGVVVDSFTSRTDDQDSAVTYTGNWVGTSLSGAYQNTISYSFQSKDTFTYTFEGQGISWVSSVGPQRGIAQIYLDGVNKGTLDLYATKTQYNKIIKSFTSLPMGKHTIKIVVSGSKNPNSTSYRIVNDAFEVFVEDNNSQINYSMDWLVNSNTAFSGGNASYTNNISGKATYQFTGNSITWLTSKGSNRGIVRVFIDGVDKGTFDLYRSSPIYKDPITFSGLSSGLHTIEIVSTGTKNSSSSGYVVLIDAFKKGYNEQ